MSTLHRDSGYIIISHTLDRWLDYVTGIRYALEDRRPENALEMASKLSEQVLKDTEMLAKIRQPKRDNTKPAIKIII